MEIRLLGSVELWSEGRELSLGSPRQRCVLAVLATAAGRPVGLDQLSARVWGERTPGDPRAQLYSYVSRLRRLLERAGAGSGRDVLRRVGGGYRLEVDAESVDLHRSGRLTAEARALGGRDDERAEALLAEAAELWRGTPLTGLDGDWAERVREGVAQERLALLENRFAVQLRLGRHASAVGPLSALVAEHPLDESFVALLMQALCGCGRQADALGVYAGLRNRLVDAIGDEPSERLRSLHERVLRRDSGLEANNAHGIGAQAAAGPAQLPAGVADFTGRTVELARLDSLLSRSDRHAVTIAVVDGIPGVGKTALAVHWAHLVRDRFPDGQLYVDLRGYAAEPPLRPAETLARLLRDLGVPPERLPVDVADSASLYRSLLADKRILVVLDNAASAEQVRPLLPGGGRSVVVVTSRDKLVGLVARDGAHRMNLDALPAADAVTLLTRMLGPERGGAEQDAVAELAHLCGRLPLALRIAAAKLVARPRQRVADYLPRLRARDRLAELAVAGDARSAVRGAFDLSYQRLPPRERRMFRALGAVAGPHVTAESVAALAGADFAEAGRSLEALARVHLVEERRTGRYTCPGLLRQYAADLAAREGR